MAKQMKIRMTDQDGKVYYWSVRHISRAWNVLMKPAKSHYINGWQYTDHEGCERFAEGSWMDLVDAFRLTASNYGFTCNIS